MADKPRKEAAEIRKEERQRTERSKQQKLKLKPQVDAAVANIAMYYASTDDDPASGGATWSSYNEFQSAEEYARGFKFKAIFSLVPGFLEFS